MIKFIILLITLLTLTHHVANAGECKSYLYYGNGQTFKSGSYLYHRNGQTFKSGSYLYHSNGQTLKSGSYFYYSNGSTAKSGNYFYDEKGNSIPSDVQSLEIDLVISGEVVGYLRVSRDSSVVISMNEFDDVFYMDEGGDLNCENPDSHEPVGYECPNYMYHSNGQTLKSGSYLYHANGQTLKSGSYLYHSTGQTMKSGSYFYHASGATAKSGSYLYDERGNSLGSDKLAVNINISNNSGTLRVSRNSWSVLRLEGSAVEFIISENGDMSCR